MNELIKEATLELRAETIINETLVKLAKKEKKETYPISRALTSPAVSAGVGAGTNVLGGPGLMALGGAVSGGSMYLSRLIQGRALRGRVSTGKGLIDWEKKNVKLNPTDKRETYPISRTVTSVPTMATVGGAAGAGLGFSLIDYAKRMSKKGFKGGAKQKLIRDAMVVGGMASLGAGLVGGGTWLNRWIYARSVVGNKTLPGKGSLVNWEKKNL